MAPHPVATFSKPAFALAVVAAVGLPHAARAESLSVQESPAVVDARASVGLGSGIAVDGWLPGRVLRVELDAKTIVAGDFSWGGVAVTVVGAGNGRSFFGLRAGYTLEYTATRQGWVSGSRFAHAPDVGAVGHLESAGGSTLEAQLGVEAVLRQEAIVCCDDAALPTSSFGVRLMLRGELALSPAWALFGEAGLRTADHLLEINVLPTAAAGVRVRL